MSPEEIAAEIDRLGDQLVELGLMGEDNRGTPRLPMGTALYAPIPGPGASRPTIQTVGRGCTPATAWTRSSPFGCGTTVGWNTRCWTSTACRSSGARRLGRTSTDRCRTVPIECTAAAVASAIAAF
jgi:hypothetical protein